MVHRQELLGGDKEPITEDTDMWWAALAFAFWIVSVILWPS